MRIMAAWLRDFPCVFPYRRGNDVNHTLHWKQQIGRHGMIIINEGKYDRHP